MPTRRRRAEEGIDCRVVAVMRTVDGVPVGEEAIEGTVGVAAFAVEGKGDTEAGMRGLMSNVI